MFPVSFDLLYQYVFQFTARKDRLKEGTRCVPEKYSICLSAIFNHDGRFLVIRRVNAGHRFWSFVGGNSEAGEQPLEALAREVREETGWLIDGGLECQPLFAHGLEDTRTGVFFFCQPGPGEPTLIGRGYQR